MQIMFLNLRFMLRRLVREEEGATAIEYALIAGLVAAVLVTVLTTLGGNIEDLFQAIADVIGGINVGSGGSSGP